MRAFPDEPGEFDALWDELCGFLNRKLPSSSSAEDIAQDAMLEALRRPPQGDGRFGAWLRVVALRRATRLARRERKRQEREFVVARREAQRFPAAAESEATDIARYVAALKEPYRTVVRMRYLEERELAEVAYLLARPAATVRSQLKRGLDQLRERLVPESGTKRRERFGLFGVWLARRRVRLRVACVAAGIAGVATLTWVVLDRSPAERAAAGSGMARVGTRAEVGRARSEPGPPVGELATPSIPAPLDESSAAAAAGAPWTASIEGVVSTREGVPVVGASVLAGAVESESGRVVARTDEEGRYRVESLGALEWIWVETEGRLPTTRFCVALCDAGRLDFVLGETLDELRGRVLAADGSPVAGARVTRRITETEGQRFTIAKDNTLTARQVLVSVVSDADGFFSLPRIDPRLPNQGYVEIDSDRHPPSIHRIPADPRLAEVEFRVPSPVRLVARVLDGNGVPLSGGVMEVVLPEPFEARRAIADEFGTVDVDRLPPGPYALRLVSHPRGTLESCFAEGVLSADSTIEVSLRAEPLIHGFVTESGRPAAGRRVLLEQARTGPFAPAERVALTQEDGSFVFTGCDPRGRFRVRLLDPTGDFCEAERSGVLPSPEAVRLDSMGLPPLESLIASCDAAASLPRMVALHSSALREPIVLRVAEDGSFASPPIPRGNYFLRFWIPGIGIWTKPLEHTGSRSPIRVPVGGTGSLEIRVFLPDSEPAAGRVSAFVACPSFFESGLLWRSIAGRDGVKRAELPPGQHKCLVRVHPFAEEFREFVVEEGRTTLVEIHIQKGRKSTLEIVGPRNLLAEEMTVRFLRPSGKQLVRLDPRANARGTDTLSTPVYVPADATGIRVRTRSGLKGGAMLTPGAPRRKIRVRLE